MAFGKQQESWLIVGLGNPGKEYERTKHNCGFRALDILASDLGCKVDKGKFQGLYGQCTYEGRKLLLLKPQTYMNLSGRSVLQLSAYFNIPPQRIIVLFDDMVDTAGSLCNAANALVEVGGAKEVYACATHGVLSGPAFERISKSVIKEIVFHNTIPMPEYCPCAKVKMLDVAPIFARCIEHIHDGTSIADLF